MSITKQHLNRMFVAAAACAAVFGLTGCVLAIGAAGGYVAADEINEGDGVFDPLEKVIPYDKGDDDDRKDTD